MYPNIGFGELPADFSAEFGDPSKFIFRNSIINFSQVLTSGQNLKDLSVFGFSDADFFWSYLVGVKTGNYNVNFAFPDGSWMSNSLIQDRNMVGTPAAPFPIFPAVMIPAGGKIGVELLDTSGAGNTVVLALWGIKRIPLRG